MEMTKKLVNSNGETIEDISRQLMKMEGKKLGKPIAVLDPEDYQAFEDLGVAYRSLVPFDFRGLFILENLRRELWNKIKEKYNLLDFNCYRFDHHIYEKVQCNGDPQ